MEPAHCSVLAAQCTEVDLESMLMRKMFKTISVVGVEDNNQNTYRFRFIIGAWSSELDF